MNSHKEIDNDDEMSAHTDNSFGHLWIFGQHPSHRCQCGIVERKPEMTWATMSTLEETFQPKLLENVESKKLTLKSDILVTNLLFDLASPKMSALVAAIETAETLSSVGTVISIK